jgi:flagellin
MLSIQTNVNSLVAQQNLNVNNQFQSQTIEQLTSGYRINSSGDDAAGLAVANQFRNSIAEVTQGVANGNNAVAQLQIMDGGTSNISQILDRLQTLATESASSSFTGDRTVLNNEFQTDIGEINRQAQAIGLNTGGTFAKTLSVYLGGGSGPTAASTLANGVVSVNLGQSTVDAQSLGLNGVQATNGAAYDLGSASTTSVAAILADTTDNTTTVAGQTQFSFAGPGFGGGVSISVNLNGVADAADLAANVNAAIQTAAQGTSGAAAAFKNANITASIVTNASGQQQLGFTSSTAAFQVSSGDKMASALMGSFDTTVGAAAGSAAGFSEIAGGSQELGTVTAGVNTEHDLTWGTAMAVTDSQVISISANDASGTAHPLSVTLADATNGVTEAQAITAINNKLQQSNDSTLQQITAVQGSSGGINFISTLPGFTVSVGSNTTSGDGITSSVGDSLQAMQVGTGSTADISTVQGATSAVSAVAAAVQLLGSAQAAIGKGENQLNYALNLASSQITNFSAAESQIRDADVAQEAANLTKAQVLQQASIAAMAQANSAPQAVLSLLKG